MIPARRLRLVRRDPSEHVPEQTRDFQVFASGPLRIAVFRFDRDATAGEVETLQDLAHQAVAAGAHVAFVLPAGASFELWEEEGASQ